MTDTTTLPRRPRVPLALPPETPAARARRLLVLAAEAQVAAFGRTEAVARFQATARHIGSGWFAAHEKRDRRDETGAGRETVEPGRGSAGSAAKASNGGRSRPVEPGVEPAE